MTTRALASAGLCLALLAGCRSPPEPPAPAGAPATAPGTSPAAPAPSAGLPPMPQEAAGDPVTDLAARLDALGGSGELRLPAGTYVLSPTELTDAACALCPGDDWATGRPLFTAGLRVSGKGIRITGAGSGTTILRTRSGYGVLFDGCEDCSISGVTVMEGSRDPDPGASDGGIVVRQSTVTITDCVIADNLGSDFAVEEVVTGISGIVVREGGVAVIERCRIVRSSWDGVAVLRGGRAELRDVLIDGVDLGAGRTATGGRGVGLRVTGASSATADGVLVARHAGGMAAFGDGKLQATDCVIEESSSYGVLARQSGEAIPELKIHGLLVHRVAACGVGAVGALAPSSALVDVRLVLTGVGGPRSGPCDAAPLDVPAGLSVVDTGSWLTTGPQGGPGDSPADEFRRAAMPLLQRLASRPATRTSAFVASDRPAP